MLTLFFLTLAPALLPQSPAELVTPPARAIRYRVDLEAPRAEVWRAWTTESGLSQWFAPAARIELEPLGRFEVHFSPERPAGQRGAEDNLFLAVQEPELLAFTWDAPPHLPEARRQRTSVALRLEELPGQRTRLWFEQSGFGRGGQWDQAFEYFTPAWKTVLARLRLRCAQGPLDPRSPLAPDALEPFMAGVVAW
jgi:uncharacterized protein YndB with AHSA1/START domain